ncbi:MAG: hypothetical protein EPN92_13960 [Chitinophagaceae bacterium]|nr:MAG: hypothetical protein EPN92_13960 [Chitinophagaceae bacterium]
MFTKKIIVISAAVAVMAGGIYGYSEYNRKPANLERVRPDVQVSAIELIKTFEDNEQDANAKFLDKVISVKGKIKSVEKNDKGYYTVILGEKEIMSSVRCSMDSVHQQKAAGLTAGTEITMKGACTGYNADELLGSDVILNRCVVSK